MSEEKMSEDELLDKYYCSGLKELQDNIADWRDRKGFITNSELGKVTEKLMLIHEEVTEAFQELRRFGAAGVGTKNFSHELADIVIRILDLAAGCNIDLSFALAEKMMINEGRPYMHGKKL